MDTVCSITVYDMENMSGERAEKAIDGAFSLCAEYEALLSATKEGTDVYRINHAGGEPVECDPRTVDVIEMGIKYGDLSEGKFDITIGKVTDLWIFTLKIQEFLQRTRRSPLSPPSITNRYGLKAAQ